VRESFGASAGSAGEVELLDTSVSANGKVSALPATLLHAEGVTKRWQRGRLSVLQSVDLGVERGTLLSIVGANGVGKTTLLRILAGLILPDAGSVRLDGLDPKKDRAAYQRRIGLLPAGYGGMYARLTVRQQLGFSARISFVPAARRQLSVDEALARFGLFELSGRRLDRLSMGQRQRVRLAITFLHQPDLVLLDEPWNSLDTEGEHLLAATLIELRSRGGSAICCTPTGIELARNVNNIDRVLRLEAGSLHTE
jgi:ABC-type multidrug transport system ATPase subunit